MPEIDALPETISTDAREPTPCPACAGRLYPKLLACADCGLEVTTRYAANEFADLEAESLHLLRIFVLCEGRIRDMEAALGVSYPTVKARLAALREKLGLTGESTAATAPAPEPQPIMPTTVQGVLDALESGSIGYDAAMQRIKALRAKAQ
jgi:hypothetical protein